MPWPMVHLTVAHLVQQGRPSPSFVLGNIAPNAVLTRNNVNDQMKWASHLCAVEGVLPRVREIQQFHVSHTKVHLGEEYRQFLLGYAAHLYVDLRWAETVYKGMENLVERIFLYRWYTQFRSFQSLYNRDVTQLEYILMDTHPETKQLLEALESAPAAAMGELVSVEEVDDYRYATLRRLEEPIKPRSLRLMDVERVERFIEETADELSFLLPSWAAASPVPFPLEEVYSES
ncbi:hypothetical protein [Paenibacillus sp. Marseille-Q4541]|uniref:hypothetical protein n=1 Tax=Paenibacillus sp. Marseille-Q4541 TaxID=2831522 RepID=UPI001BA7DB0A|nr:hypothetical protein [Paenibacillus sp. Marseille-Q4541]